ncbi:MAG TPA: arylsulfotransferase family protein [Solirubrobacter sp.]|nr:arylsulfotransferase family protein [Solirubrobacter sp.]
MVRTRRRSWVVGVAVAAMFAVAFIVLGRGGTETDPATAEPALPPDQQFHSRPDLRPPQMTVETLRGQTAPGKLLLAPKRRPGQRGVAILDERGTLVWWRPMRGDLIANDLRVQRFRGRPVLTWWEGRTNDRGYGKGSWVIADTSYREIARVRAGNGSMGDLHDMVLTPQGTALITVYEPFDADLRLVNSPRPGRAVDSIIQEVEIPSGKVLWEWHSKDHVALAESMAVGPKTPRTLGLAYDYFHINSIDIEPDGDLLVSARNTWALYKIDRPSGKVLWRLGGRRSDFALGPGVRFAWQHDARRMPDGTITVFDNQATPRVEDRSSAVVIKLDERRRRATVVREVSHPDKVLSIAEGNAQMLPGGGFLIGWGMARRVSELSADGKLLFDLRLPRDTDTYRAYRMPWRGMPAERPQMAAERDGDKVTAWASWNGATEVTHWELLAGDTPRTLRRVALVRRQGFETELTAETDAQWVAVRALRGAKPLARSAPRRVDPG